jgi:hypothetical protein
MTLLFMKLGWKQWHYQIPQIVSLMMEFAFNIILGAVRDDVDPLLNYVVNFSRDEPITVEQVHMITSKDKST